MRALAAVLLLVATQAWPAGCPKGSLTPAGPQTGTGASGDSIDALGAPSVAFQVINTAGTATVQIEMCCQATCSSWAVVENSPMSLTAGSSLAKSVLRPTCVYRANATACSGCSFTVATSCSR